MKRSKDSNDNNGKMVAMLVAHSSFIDGECLLFSNFSKFKSFPISNFENNDGGNRRRPKAEKEKSPHDSLAIGGLQEAKVQNRRRGFQCHKGHYNGKWGT